MVSVLVLITGYFLLFLLFRSLVPRGLKAPHRPPEREMRAQRVSLIQGTTTKRLPFQRQNTPGRAIERASRQNASEEKGAGRGFRIRVSSPRSAKTHAQSGLAPWAL